MGSNNSIRPLLDLLFLRLRVVVVLAVDLVDDDVAWEDVGAEFNCQWVNSSYVSRQHGGDAPIIADVRIR